MIVFQLLFIVTNGVGYRNGSLLILRSCDLSMTSQPLSCYFVVCINSSLNSRSIRASGAVRQSMAQVITLLGSQSGL